MGGPVLLPLKSRLKYSIIHKDAGLIYTKFGKAVKARQ